MTPATRLLLVISGCLVLLLAALFLVYPYFRPQPEEQAPVVNTPVDPSTLTPLPADNIAPETNFPVQEQPVATSESAQRAEAERLTRTFVETYGSYSNFSEFSNITSLEPFMTESMKAYARGQVQEQGQPSVTEYVGVTSQLISLTVASFTVSSQASLNFVVQQETQRGLTAPIETAYRDGRVDLVYQNNQWLVNGIFYN
jgi:hypothetical protein